MLDTLLLLIALLASGGFVVFAWILTLRACAWFDQPNINRLMAEYDERMADYMEDRAHGLDQYPTNDWYEWAWVQQYLVTRWLFTQRYDALYAIWKFQRGGRHAARR